MIRVLLLGSFFLAVACGPTPDPTSLIVKPRIIGATYAVDGAPERASARPGESVRVEFLLTQKEEPVQNTWAIIVCRPAATAFGIGFCEEGDPLTFAIGATPTLDAPSFVVDVPEGPAEDLLFIGAVCMGGQVNLDINMDAAMEITNPCVDEGVGQLVTGSVFVAEEERDNLSPGIAEVRFNDEVWTAEPEELSGCEGLDMPQIRTGTADEHTIEVDPVPGSREPFLDESFDPPVATNEDLPVAFYATDLGISNLFSVIDAEPGATAFEATPTAEITYVTEEIEDPVEAGGRVVRFEIVMRDDRGGMDRVTRALCLLP
ncbi:MAG: hypothetical protein AB8H86_04050 [Polyangiales bacterium]